jgi:hypothetical protein
MEVHHCPHPQSFDRGIRYNEQENNITTFYPPPHLPHTWGWPCLRPFIFPSLIIATFGILNKYTMKTLLLSAVCCLLSLVAFSQQNMNGQAKTAPHVTVTQKPQAMTPHRSPNNTKTTKPAPAKTATNASANQSTNSTDKKFVYKCSKCGYTSSTPGKCPQDGTVLVESEQAK